MKTGSRAIAFLLIITMTVAMVAPCGRGAHAAMNEKQTNYGVNIELIDRMLDRGKYKEGEAIAIVKKGFAYKNDEKLSEVDKDTLMLSIDGVSNTDKGLAKQAAVNADGDEDEYTITHIVDKKLDTRELLIRLGSDPDVIECEPNYIIEPEKVSGAGTGPNEDAQVGKAASSKTEASVNNAIKAPDVKAVADGDSSKKNSVVDKAYDPASVGDLSANQWYITSENAKGFKTPNAPEGNARTINIPGWNGTADNASGTVAVMDTGIDVNHPDLKDSIYTFSEEQQKKYGCGPYGINMEPVTKGLTEEENRRDITDYMLHGTHVAGIIAGAWNGYGVSGIAKGVKVFGVRVFGRDGMEQDYTNVVRGFDWLAKVAKEVNLKAVNVSLGSLNTQLVHTILVNKLGRLGVNVIYAAGNFPSDLDEEIDMGGQNTSPYAITVNAMNQDGKPAFFSAYGQSSTDVYVPGVQMLSTVPSVVRTYGESGGVMSYVDQTRVFPDKTDASHFANGYMEKYTSDTPEVLVYDSCPVNEDGSPNTAAKLLGSRATGAGIGADDESSWSVKPKDFKVDGKHNMVNGDRVGRNMWLAVPVEEGKTPAWLSLRAAVNDKTHYYIGFTGAICEGADGKPVHTDMLLDDYLMVRDTEDDHDLVRGISKLSSISISSLAWTQYSVNLKGFVDEFEYLKKNISAETRKDIFWSGDPGDVNGLYNWSNNGKKYILIQFGSPYDPTNRDVFNDGTCMYLDDVAILDEGAAAGAYAYENGTSMSAPMVTAIMSILAKDEPQASTLSDEELSVQALERASKLLASVEYDDALKNMCTTGGRIDLHSAFDFSKKAPIICSCTESKDKVSVSGYFFGEGKLYVDDKEIDALTRSDNEIVFSTSGLGAGAHVVCVVNSDEKRAQKVFGVTGDKLYEKTHSTPYGMAGFESDMTDGFSGNMVATDKYIFAMSANMYDLSKALWRYTRSTDTWKRCADIPKAIRGRTCETSGMVVKNGKIYVYTYRKGLDTKKGCLYTYNIAKNKWSKTFSKNLAAQSKIVLINKNIFLVNDSGMKKINLKTGKLTKVKGKLPVLESVTESYMAGSGKYLYLYGYNYDSEFNRTYHMYRIKYNKKKNKITKENLTSVVKKTLKTLPTELVLTEVKGGVAVITPVTGKGYRQDTHIIKNSAKKITTLKRTSCYHKVTKPLAVYSGGRLYALGINDTENDTLFFRSTKL